MPFKINISDKGKTFQLETELEMPVGKKIGETIQGSDISPDLEGYELLITGISDIAGLPGFKGLEGSAYHRRLLTKGPGMHNARKGIRLRKTNRGEEISLKISQINTKVIKQGKTKFEDLIKKQGGEIDSVQEIPAEKPMIDNKNKEQPPAEQKPAEEDKQQ